jgi:hypothetical protein
MCALVFFNTGRLLCCSTIEIVINTSAMIFQGETCKETEDPKCVVHALYSLKGLSQDENPHLCRNPP